MKIAVEGCCHGELDKIYETIAYLEQESGDKVDLLVCCGDFQAVRNPSDLGSMAVPPKFQKLNTFYKYYSGERKAPILTIFIGGNHEASNYLQELAYGGWVAPNIYYLGYAGVVQVGGVRIGGVSGIYKSQDYIKGRHEHLPYTESTKRSVYHTRNIDIFRLKQLRRPLDVMLSHDWPEGVYNHGNRDQLAQRKPFFIEDMANGCLGSPPSAELLYALKPRFWFSAHLHVKFAALVQHESEDGLKKETRFLALDKCLPKRRFLQLLDIAHDEAKGVRLQLDPEWLCILKSTDHLMTTTACNNYMPRPDDRLPFAVSEEDISDITRDFGGDLTVPENFQVTAATYRTPAAGSATSSRNQPRIHINPQTTLFCQMLDITDPASKFVKDPSGDSTDGDRKSSSVSSSSGSGSGSDGENPSYDSFIISRDLSSSSLGMSSLKLLDESLGANLSDISANGSEVSFVKGDASPPRGLLSPPLTSNEEKDSDKDSSPYLTSSVGSPKRLLDSQDLAQVLFSTPKRDAMPDAPNLQPDSPSLQPGSPNPQPGSPSLQPGSPSLQPGSPSLQPGTQSLQPGSPIPQLGSPIPQLDSSSLQPDMPSLQPYTPNPQLASPSIQSAMPSLQPYTPSLQPATPSPQKATPSPQTTTPSQQTATRNHQTATPSPQPATPASGKKFKRRNESFYDSLT